MGTLNVRVCNVGKPFSPELRNVTLNFCNNSYFQPPTAVEYSREKDFTDFVWAGAVNLLSLARWGILFVFIMTAIALLDLPKKEKRQGVSSVPKDRVVSEQQPPFTASPINTS